MTTIRPAGKADLPRIAAIQAVSPEAGQWDPGAEDGYDVQVAERGGRVTGFLIARRVAEDEYEILNLAVHPDFRRGGVAKELLKNWLESHTGTVFLEVRASNQGARNLYKSMEFKEVGIRTKYYDKPSEAAIVLRFHSC